MRVLGWIGSAVNQNIVADLGTFEYNLEERPVQTFTLDPDNTLQELSYIDHIRMEVLSNHGHADFTCVYRFRVHGNELSQKPR